MLLAALVVLVALAVAVSVSQRPSDVSGQLLLPDLKARLNDIDKIVVRTGGNKTIATLARQKDGWVLVERGSYPADVGKIRKDLIALAEAKVLEEKTSNPEFYNQLGVDDIAKETAGGVQLDLGRRRQGHERDPRQHRRRRRRARLRAPGRRADELARQRQLRGAPRDRRVARPRRDEHSAASAFMPSRSRIRTGTRCGSRSHRATPPISRCSTSRPAAPSPSRVPATAIGSALSDLTLETVEPASGFAPGDVKADRCPLRDLRRARRRGEHVQAPRRRARPVQRLRRPGARRALRGEARGRGASPEGRQGACGRRFSPDGIGASDEELRRGEGRSRISSTRASATGSTRCPTSRASSSRRRWRTCCSPCPRRRPRRRSRHRARTPALPQSPAPG